MKQIIIILFFIIILTPKTFAKSSSFKTFTPMQPYYGYNYNKHGRYLPPPTNYQTNPHNKYWKRRNYYNNNKYNYPYYNYYPQKTSVFSTIGDFFSGGKITGYTNSNFDNTNIPYGYQQEFQDSDGNYYQNNYGYQNGASIKILD